MRRTEIYVVRNQDGKLKGFWDKPFKKNGVWKVYGLHQGWELQDGDLPKGINPNWDDLEPRKMLVGLQSPPVPMKLRMYLACDDNDVVYIYKTKPKKDVENGCWIPDCRDAIFEDMYMKVTNFDLFFPHLKRPKWEDAEPLSVIMDLKEFN